MWSSHQSRSIVEIYLHPIFPYLFAKKMTETVAIGLFSNFRLSWIKMKNAFNTWYSLQIAVKINEQYLIKMWSHICSSHYHTSFYKLEKSLSQLPWGECFQVFATCFSLALVNLLTRGWSCPDSPILEMSTLRILEEASVCETVRRIDLILCYMCNFLLWSSAFARRILLPINVQN